MPIYSQNLSDYQWKNRVLIIKYNDHSKDLFKEQRAFLEGEAKGLKERKMLLVFCKDNDCTFKDYVKDEVYTLQNGKRVKLDFPWKDKATFELVLLGLDGGVKFRKDSPITSEELYAIIDGMPMRRAELGGKYKTLVPIH